ncbi:hypothetical protein GCM10022226_11250 [Sphaerisporangium flaviroseum]|uniref:Uncharacterized protein n=1 Tax=Sphaerisporangium flaviroseum TaxID=509199 RepID=A0ABP7HJZ3_9ACTN
MLPEFQYQLIVDRVAELHQEASDHRRANLAVAGKKARERSSQQRLRTAFGKLRTS